MAIEAGVYGLLGPAGVSVLALLGGPTLPWWLFAAVAFLITTYLGYGRGHSLWRVRIAPALGLLGLTAALILILENLKDLVGGSSVLAWVIVGLLASAFGVGIGPLTRMRVGNC